MGINVGMVNVLLITAVTVGFAVDAGQQAVTAFALLMVIAGSVGIGIMIEGRDEWLRDTSNYEQKQKMQTNPITSSTYNVPEA